MKNENMISVKCGGNHSLFLSEKKLGLVGFNYYGQLGSGNFEDVISPVLFSIENKKIIQSLLLWGSSIFFTEDSEVWGCGNNNWGQLFNGKKKLKNPKIMKICDLKVKMNPNHISLSIKLNDMKERFDFVGKIPIKLLYL